MPSKNPSRPTLFAPTLLALSLALLGAPAQAAERYWTFIGGCGSADWFGMPDGSVNAQSQSNCWTDSGLTFPLFPFTPLSGRSLPTANDNVYIQHSGSLDLVNRLALPARDANLIATANSLTLQGLGQGFASLAIDRNALDLLTLNVGTEGKGAILQTGGEVRSREVFLGRSRDSVGRYELSGGRLLQRSPLAVTTARSTLFLGQSGVGELVQSGGELGANYISVGTKVATTLTSSWTMTGGAAGADVLGVGTVLTFNPSSGQFSGLEESAFGRVEVSGSAQLYVDALAVGLSGRLNLKGGEIQVGDMALARTDAFVFNDGTLAFSPTRNGLSGSRPTSSRFENLQGDTLPLLFGAGLEAGLPTVRLLPKASLTVPEVQVGSFGRGRLEVLAGASLKSDRGGVGASPLPLMVRSEALLDGTVAVLGNSVPASWTVRDRLDIGGGDMATITVRNGALLKTGSAAMGDTRAKLNDTERNEVRIEGSGSRWENTGDLWVGGGAAGVGRASDLWLVNGGRLTVGGTLQVHAGSSLLVENGGSWSAGKTVNEGLIEIAFGTMTTVDGPLELRGGSRLYVDGPLTLNGPLDVASGATLETLKELQLNGLVTLRDGAALTGPGTKVFAGGLSVGNSPGVFTDNSSDALVRLASTNIYFAEIGGTSNGSFDRYILNGQLHLGGTLKLISWAGYGGQAGASFDLFDGTLSGSFDQIDTSSFALASGLAWDFAQLSSTGVVGITAVPEPGTWALWLGGLAALGASAGRRRSRC